MTEDTDDIEISKEGEDDIKLAQIIHASILLRDDKARAQQMVNKIRDAINTELATGDVVPADIPFALAAILTSVGEQIFQFKTPHGVTEFVALVSEVYYREKANKPRIIQ